MPPFPSHFFESFLAALAMVGAPFALLGLALAYAVLHLRDSRNEEHDPEIGIKSALYFLFSLSILLILTGLTFIVVDLLREDKSTSTSKTLSDFNEMQRNGFALIVAGFALGLFHLVFILGFTNDRRFPAVKRVFVGWRLAIHSLVVLVTFTILVIQMFQKSIDFESVKQTFGVLLVWGPSWLIHLILLRFYGSAPVPRIRMPTIRRDDEE
jgi:hypothetical protein